MERAMQMILGSKALKKYAALLIVIGALLALSGGYRKQAIWLCAVIVVLFLAYELVIYLMARKKSNAFAKGLGKDMDAPAGGKVSARKAQDELSKRWKSSVTELKKAGMDLYTLPWYLLIGEPQSGKSTTLKNSGLEFPVGTEALSGAGGTRNCDWWFTNEAIVLDTAGRFSFQEKNAPDASEWKTFLNLLRKNRARCPINGLILVIPCTSLLGDSTEERDAKAMNVREKLVELQRELGVQFPVFVLVTKSDQILGFTEFFSRLPATDQRQILGWSTPGKFIQAFDPDQFNKAFDSVHGRVHKLRLKILGEDLSLTELDKLFVFPDEFRAVGEPLKQYLKSIFVKTHYLPPLFFRGFYFTSGLQEGTPIAKACAAMLRNTGAGAEAIVESLAETFARSKAFFIRDFYTDKLFLEQNLVIHSVKKLGSQRKLAWAAVAASALLMIATVGFMGVSIWRLREGIGAVKDRIGPMSAQFAAVAGRTEAPDDAELRASLERSTEFSKAIDEVKAGSSSEDELIRWLTDVHWMHFLNNVYFRNALPAYGSLTAESPPADSERLDRSRGDYISAWSLNHLWLEHTRRGEGPFADAERLPAMALNLRGGPDEALQASFESERLKAIEALKGGFLDFSDGVGSDNPPIALALVPGRLAPEDNEFIRREVQRVRQELRLPPPEIIAEVTRSATDARDEFNRRADDLFAPACGLERPTDDPFASAILAKTAVAESFDRLRSRLAESERELANISLGRDRILQYFHDLPWTERAFGPARAALDDYFGRQTDEIVAARAVQAEEAQAPLRQFEGMLTQSDGRYELSAPVARMLEGLDRYGRLASAQKDFIGAMVQAPIGDERAIEAKIAEWQSNVDRRAAEAWAAGPAAADARDPDAWRVAETARRLAAAVDEADESVRVEAWLHYAQDRTTKLGREQIEAAQPMASPHPPAALWANIEQDDLTLARVHGELDRFRNGGLVKCGVALRRLQDRLGELTSARARIEADFQEYWAAAFRNWRPSNWLAPNDNLSWETFRNAGIVRDSNIFNRVTSEMSDLLVNVGRFRTANGGALDNAFLNRIYTQLDQTINGAGSSLQSAARDFSLTVDELQGDRIAAWRLLHETRPTDGRRRRDLLERLGGLSPTELGEKLNYFPTRAVRLIDPTADLFPTTLGEFLDPWRSKLAGKFPFRLPVEQSPTVPRDVEVTLEIPQATAIDARDFFFSNGRPQGLQAFMRENASVYESWSRLPGNEAVATFIDQCNALRDWLFEGDRYRTLEFSVRYLGARTLSDREPEGILAEYEFAQLEFSGLRDLDRTLVFRRPTGAPQVERATWTPANLNYQGQFSLLVQNRGTGRVYDKRLRVTGDFSMLAYLYSRGAGGFSLDRTAVERISFPYHVRTASAVESDEHTVLRALFTFDFAPRALPTLPDWAPVERWLGSIR